MDLFTLGETMVCISASETGSLEYVSTLSKSIGGAESNTAIGLARLGKKVAWSSKLGDDPFGHQIIKTIRGEGVDVSKVTMDQTNRTGLMIKEVRAPNKIHVYYYRQNSAASALTEADIDIEALIQARRVHLTGITLALGEGPRLAVHKILQVSKEYNIPASFDLNLRQKLWSIEEAKQEYQKIYPYIETLFMSEEEAILCSGEPTIDKALDYYKQCGLDESSTVVIKQGDKGVLGIRREQQVYQSAVKGIEVIDTVGAGDGFNAGYLFGELEGLCFQECLRLGNWVGAKVVEHQGDYQGLPTLAEYQAYKNREITIER